MGRRIRLGKDKKLPIALLNGTIATTNGIYSIEDLDIDTAKHLVKENGFTSAIGHDATAEIMADLLESDIRMNRIQFQQQVGQIAIVFKLNERPPEGTILSRKEIEDIGYSLKKMKRLE